MAQVLLVDDDTNVLLTLAIALRRAGHTVTVAQNGWQALNLLRRQPFTFLISDVKMPGMSGVELAQRAHDLNDPPRVVLTSALDVEVSQELVEAFMPKPIDVARLHQFLISEAHGGSACFRHVSSNN
ncbi:MAG: response regulator [Armatimonadetes bacterium]|nr:response regulator [Armatimonadota bacterium]